MDNLLEGGRGGAEILVKPRGPLALPHEFLGVTIEPFGGRTRLQLEDAARASQLVAWLASHGHEVISLTPERQSLEDLFMNLFHDAHTVGGDPEHDARERREA
jgi:hypothetical protein